jgi:biopolymer transport protein ExbB/TolQ
MTKDEVLAKLRALENRLRSAEVQNFMAGQPQNVKDNFVEFRIQLSQIVAQLGNAQLEDIAARLNELSPDLQAGIGSLENALSRLDDAIAIINTISSLVGLVGRVIAL